MDNLGYDKRLRGALLDLLNDHKKRGHRIHELERELARAKDTLHGMEEFHRQDEFFVSDGFPPLIRAERVSRAREHAWKTAATTIGKMMLEKGYIGMEETMERDEGFMGTTYRFHAKATVLKQECRKALSFNMALETGSLAGSAGHRENRENG